MADKTKKMLLIEAQNEVNEAVADKRVDVLHALEELGEINAEEDYCVTIRKALHSFKGTIPLAFLGQVLPDSNKLAEARKAMKGTADTPPEIEEVKDVTDKTKIIIRQLKSA